MYHDEIRGMTPVRLHRLASHLLAAAAVAACAGARPPAVETAPPAPAPARPLTDSVAIARARADSARLPWTAADARFMTGMIGHHAQAIEMAKLAPANDASPAVRRLAERIINAQADEILLMQQWLADRRQPVPEARASGVKHVMDGVEHEMLMPGMLTAAQMTELAAARGKAFDELFLTLMIRHHRGAVAMVKELFGSYGAGQDETVFKFASDVNVDQSTEIARMEQMLLAVKLERMSR